MDKPSPYRLRRPPSGGAAYGPAKPCPWQLLGNTSKHDGSPIATN